MPKKKNNHLFQPVDYSQITPDSKDYNFLLWKNEFFCVQELSNKELKKDALALVKEMWKWSKDEVSAVRGINDAFFASVGKYCHALINGAKLKEKDEESLKKLLKQRMLTANAVEEEEIAPKPKKTIQNAMWAQIEPLINTFDAAIDSRDWKLDIQRTLMGFEHAKAAQCRIVLNYYQNELDLIETAEAEEFEHFSKAELQKLKKFIADIIMNCNTVIMSQKVTRKPRIKKSPTKDKIVAKLKYQKDFAELGMVSINVVDIVESNIFWFYNTKKRTLGFYDCSTGLVQNAISAKGASIIGFERCGEKKVRKPEELKGLQKLSRTKIQKLYDSLTTKEAVASPRLSADTIILKKF